MITSLHSFFRLNKFVELLEQSSLKESSSNIFNTKDCFQTQFQTPRKELNKRRVARYFWGTLRCLEMWSITVLNVWCIFSIKNKTKEKTEKLNDKKICQLRRKIQTQSRSWLPLFKLDELSNGQRSCCASWEVNPSVRLSTWVD